MTLREEPENHDKSIRHSISAKISELRAAKGLTQQQVADAAGISRISVIRLEKGIYSVSVEILGRILEVLDAKLAITSRESEEPDAL